MNNKFLLISLLSFGFYCSSYGCNLPSLINPDLLPRASRTDKRKYTVKRDDSLKADFGFYTVETENKFHTYDIERQIYRSHIILASLSDDCITPKCETPPAKPDTPQAKECKRE